MAASDPADSSPSESEDSLLADSETVPRSPVSPHASTLAQSLGFLASWSPPGADKLNALLPGYQVEKLLGRGGMGAVYLARQLSLERPVAIKVLPFELNQIDPSFAARFEREAKAMAQLMHPNIVTVHDFGQTSEGHSFFVMEYVEGTNFHQWIHAGDLTAEEALQAMSTICEALQFAHEKGYVHRDIKPANIFVSRDGLIKIGDFGLAKVMTELEPGREESESGLPSPPSLTMTGVGMGTPAYSAPEQIEGRPVDHRADIYSLGVMLYEMLTRELPRGHFPPPSQRAPVDSRLDQVVLKAMESQPERRYATASEMRTEVEEVRTGSQEIPPPPVAPAPAAPPRKSASRVPIFIGAGLTVSLLAGALIVWWQQQGPRTGPREIAREQPESSSSGELRPGDLLAQSGQQPVLVVAYEKVTVIKGATKDAVIPLAPSPDQNTAAKSLEFAKRLMDGESITPQQAEEGIFGSQEALLTDGTEVRVLEQAASPSGNGFGALLQGLLPMTKVEVLSGPHQGKQGWVLSKLLEERRVPRTSP